MEVSGAKVRARSLKLSAGIVLLSAVALAGCSAIGPSAISLPVGEWYQDGASAAPSSIGDYTLLTNATKEQHGLACEGNPLRGWHSGAAEYSELYVHEDAWESLREFDDRPCDGISAATSWAPAGIVRVLWMHVPGEHKAEPACVSSEINAGCYNYFYGGSMELNMKTPVAGGNEAERLAFLEAFYRAYTEAFPNLE